jgi:hypothetical protein
MLTIESTSFIDTQEALAQMWLTFGLLYAKFGFATVFDALILIGFVAAKVNNSSGNLRHHPLPVSSKSATRHQRKA